MLINPGTFRTKGNVRRRLQRLLRSDGATVADYQPGVGVTGTLNASAWANQIGVAPALAQATGANQPIYLPFSGSKYAWFPGAASNTFSSPNKSISGNVTMTVDVALDDWTPASTISLLDNRAGSRGIFFGVNIGPTYELFILIGDNAGYQSAASTVGTGLADGTRHTISAVWTDGVGVTFYVDGAQLGAPVALAKTLAASTGALIVGPSSIAQKIYRVQVTANNSYDLNASDWSETSTNGATQVSSTTGETWTLNNTGAKLAQIVGSPQLLFDGTAGYMATGAFTLNQPTTVYFVGKQVTWTVNDFIWDGVADNLGTLQQSTATPRLAMYAGTALLETTGRLAVNTYGVVTAIYNGATSSLQVDSNAALTGAVGASNMGGFTLGKPGTTNAQYGNIQVKEVIIRNVADSAATQAQIQAYLKALHGTP